MSVPYNLYNDYKKFERIVKKYEGSNTLDTSSERFLAPTTLIPLLCFIMDNDITRIITHPHSDNYVKRIINGETTSTNTPYQILPKSAQERQDKELSRKMVDKIDSGYGGNFVLFHIISELTNNIYNHTSFEDELASYGYTYAQKYPNSNQLDICVMDDGLSIPGRFTKSGINYTDDCEAIQKAINNTSTASNDSYKRGNGLWTSIRLAVEGTGGEVLIISRNGGLHIKSEDNFKYFTLDNGDYFKGTLISMRLNKQLVLQPYDLIDLFPGVKYEYNPIKRSRRI